jgi:hypothetical protein
MAMGIITVIKFLFGYRAAIEAGADAAKSHADAAATNGWLSSMNPAKALATRARAYRRLLGSNTEDAKIVLADLARFCRIGRNAYSSTDRETCMRLGRQEVMQRILDTLALTEEQLALQEKDKP